jgi:adenosylcobinamide-phosphate synthase
MLTAEATVVAKAAEVADYRSFWFGALYWSAGAALSTASAWWLEQGIWQAGLWAAAGLTGDATGDGMVGDTALWLTWGARALLLALLLKPMLAWAMLKSEVQAVEAALNQSLETGRSRLGWLVSRDTGTLTAEQVRESAIESLAENLSDSVVAPIFWFVLLGLPGAVLYRFANTADAMWGYKGLYKGNNWEWAGKWAARVDDVLNWLPSRLTGLLLALSCGVRFKPLRREAVKTPSPNSGWPMAAMALALDIHLGKPGVYVLNPAGGAPRSADVSQALVYAGRALLALAPLVLVVLLLKAGCSA